MRVFITGMTGSLGTALALLHASRGDTVFGCARNEQKCIDWMWRYGRDQGTLYIADAFGIESPMTSIGALLPTVDRVYHCAAMKHVDRCEAQPIEAVEQNVLLTNVICSVCKLANVPLVFISSDKACLPQGVYGATKLLGEGIAVADGASAVRLGNLIGSSGSVFTTWRDAVRRGERIKVTDPEMTRYFMTVGRAAEFAADCGRPGYVTAPADLKSVRIGDVAEIVANGRGVDVVGLRPGETQHQWLIAPGTSAEREGDIMVLGRAGAPTIADGLNSATAGRWDVTSLLAAAGVMM